MTNAIRKLFAIVASILAAGSLAPMPALALTIDPGFDLFQTNSPGSFVDLSDFIAGIPDPLTVPLQGVPAGPNLGNTDTIVRRLSGIDPFPNGSEATIDIELVALQLVSISPVNIGGNWYDVGITDGVFTELFRGQMTIFRDSDDGGRFDMFLDVQLTKTLKEVGNENNGIVYDISGRLSGSGMWSHTAQDDFYPTIPNLPAGGFFPGPTVWSLDTGDFVMDLSPAMIPEPTTVTLTALALLSLLTHGRRRRA